MVLQYCYFEDIFHYLWPSFAVFNFVLTIITTHKTQQYLMMAGGVVPSVEDDLVNGRAARLVLFAIWS